MAATFAVPGTIGLGMAAVLDMPPAVFFAFFAVAVVGYFVGRRMKRSLPEDPCGLRDNPARPQRS